MTGGERASELDQELIASLEKIDGLLASEQQAAARGRAEAEAAADAASGSPGGRGTFGDEDDDFGDPVGSGQTGEERGASATAESEAGDGSTEEASSDGSSSPAGSSVGGGGGGRVPADIPDGSDDDIVARQLREAAMSEEDPELREKLWDEYRDYKAGGKKKND
jgi:hypothetical protein